MMISHISKMALAVALITWTVGCGQKEEPTPSIKTRETENAKEQVQESRVDPSAGQKAEVERAFADLEKEIRELEVRVEKTEGEARAEAQYKVDALKARRDELRKEYNQAKFDQLVNDVKAEIKSWTK